MICERRYFENWALRLAGREKLWAQKRLMEKSGKSWLLEKVSGLNFERVARNSNFAGWLLETLLEVWEERGWEERRGVMITFTVLLYHRSTAEAREIEAGKGLNSSREHNMMGIERKATSKPGPFVEGAKGCGIRRMEEHHRSLLLTPGQKMARC